MRQGLSSLQRLVDKKSQPPVEIKVFVKFIFKSVKFVYKSVKFVYNFVKFVWIWPMLIK